MNQSLDKKIISMDYENMRYVAYGDFLRVEDLKQSVQELKEEIENIEALGLDEGCKNIMLKEVKQLIIKHFRTLADSPQTKQTIQKGSGDELNEKLDYSDESQKLKTEDTKPKIVIIGDNPMSIMGYAEEYPENWKRICEALKEKKNENK